MYRLQRRTATFIIRLWMEYLDQETPTFRGEIESVKTGEKTPFVDLPDLIALLRDQVSSTPQTNEVEG